VAHEVGILGAILTYYILEKEGTDAEEAKDYLKRIEKEIERINRIVRELDFAKPQNEIKEIEVNKSIENALSLPPTRKVLKISKLN
jgi:phosphoglycerate-specific signal transduction histidine kinase